MTIDKHFLGRCYEECFQYYEEVLFKALPYDYRQILLQLAFFSAFDEEVLTQILGYREEESYRILTELTCVYGVLEKQGDGNYEIENFLRIFLQKRQMPYLGAGKLRCIYDKATEYYMKQQKYTQAMRYADLNGNIENVIHCMRIACSSKITITEFIELEPYIRMIPASYIVNDEGMLGVYAMTEALYGNKKESLKYIHILNQNMQSFPQDNPNRQKLWELYQYMLILLPFWNEVELWRTIEEDKELTGELYRKSDLLLMCGIPSLIHGDKDLVLYTNELKHLAGHMREKLEAMTQNNYGGLEEIMLGEIALEQGRYAESIKYLTKGVSRASAERNHGIGYVGNMLLARVMAIKNQPEQRETILKRLEKNADINGNRLEQQNMDAFYVRLQMLSGDADGVRLWMGKRSPDENESYCVLQRYCYVTKALGYIMQGKYESALFIIHKIHGYAKEYNKKYDEWEVRILELGIAYKRKERGWEKALAAILSETQEYHLVSIYSEQGAFIYPMLGEYAKKTPKTALPAGYWENILKETKKMALLYPKYLKEENNCEDMSESEIEVLQLLAQGMSNKGIAQKTYRSENTVKYHLKNIYQKLGVRSRSEAVARIREIGVG